MSAQTAGTGAARPYLGRSFYGRLQPRVRHQTAIPQEEEMARFKTTVDFIATDAALVRARSHRGRILCLLKYLAEIDEVTADEPDQSVMPELAQLFLDIADAAEDGAAELFSIPRRAVPDVKEPSLHRP
ncbi:MAG: hypothetical protein WD270_01565 [Acetobacterales bacterium]